MDVELSVEEEGSGRTSEETVAVDDDATVGDVLSAAGHNPETVLVEHDGRIVPKDEPVEGKERLRVLQVISGG